MAIDKSQVENIYPLTPMQEGMLFHALMEPRSPAYFEQLSWVISGAIDLELFHASWTTLVARHPILRSIFVHDGADRPLQVVLKSPPLDFQVVDLRDGGPNAAAAFIDRDRARGFELRQSPPMRVAVLRLDDHRFQIVWSHHHILLDGWSVAIALGELAEIYAAMRGQRAPSLVTPTPFSKYVKWIEASDRKAAAQFWQAALAGLTERITIPHTASASGNADADRGVVTFVLDEALTAQLHRAAADAHVTLATVLHAVWAILLGRYNDASDVVFGSVVSGRSANVAGVEGMVGNLINTVPVRAGIEPDLTFAALLSRMHAAAVAAEPFLHAALSDAQSPARTGNGVFGTLVSFANYPADAQTASAADRLGFVVDQVLHDERTHYDVDVQFIPSDALRVRITYSAHCYVPSQISAIEGHMRRVLDAVLQQPGIRLDAIDIVTAAERVLLTGAVAQARGALTGQTLAQAFEAQAARTPDRIAVRASNGRLTYSELNARANAVAGTLRDRARVASDDRVGLVLGRDADLAVGILAVLKAGGCYVPLEPSLPAERMAYILRDASCRAVLTTASSLEAVATVTDVPVIDVEQARPGCTDNLPSSSTPDHLAYVIYTSGSTGRPKGVMIEQRSVLNLVAGLREHVYDRYPAPLRVALVASYSFDASVQQIFAALLLGHELVIVDDATRRDGEAMNRFLVAESVDVVDGTPTLLQLMANAEGFAAVRSRVRHALIGGEPLPSALMRQVFAVPGTMVVSNMYGPTECCVDATAHLIDASPSRAAVHVPIGRPLANVQAMVLTASGQLAPVGARGELCLTGEGVGRGYLGDATQTSEKFVECPVAPQVRMYRTADAARRLPDGTLECLGRLDDQVKVRGYRIELGEVESVLMSHPCITQAAAFVSGDLCATLVLASPVSVDELRRYLADTLPEHFIPSRFFEATALPRSSSGKLDRKALAAGDHGVPLAIASDYSAPSTPIEQKLVEVWQTVLGQPRVGIDDNYFSLGGDSIKAIQIVSRLMRDHLRVEIRDLFRYRTVRGVAPHIREVNRHAAGAAGRTSASLSAAQARFLAEHLVEPGRFHHSLVLSSDDRIDPQAIAHAFAVLRDHHPSLRLSVSAGRQHVRPAGGPLPGVAVHDLRGNSDAAGEFHALARSAQSAFDLQTDTLWRVAVFRMDAGDRLLIVVHHLCIDGVSWGTLLDDLATAYAQVCAGQPVALPPATDSFLDWSQASADLSSTPQIQSQAAYWRAVEEQIAGVRTPVRDGEAARYRDQVVLASAMSIEHTAALVSEVNRAYNTTAEDVLLAAFARAAWQCFDETRTAVTMEHHGRDGVGDLDLSRTMGWFTSLYPLVLTIDPSHDIGSQIKATKEAIRAVPDRGRGYGLLRYVAAPPVHLTARPAFSFNYLGDVDRRIGSFNLVAEELDGHVNTDAACLAEIELSAMIVARQLRLRIAYNQRRVDASVMEAFLAGWQSAVTDAIEHCRARRHTELTPADLSYSQVTVDELEDMFR